MGRKFSVEKLPIEQRQLIMKKVLGGRTNDQILAEVKSELGIEMARSSFFRWADKIGVRLAERYAERRDSVRTFVDGLKANGIKIDDNYRQIISNLEEHLLMSESDLIAQDPLKLLFARQEDERIKIKREQIGLKEKELNFEREKFERSQNASADRFKIASDTWKFILSYILRVEPSLADGLTNHSGKLLEELGEHIEQI